MTIASTSGVISGLKSVGAGGGSLRCWSAILIAEGASNGTLPVSISYSTTPSEYRSLWGFAIAELVACSGAM